METNERILFLLKERGPILPVQASKEINENILMTSARLSELLTSKRIKISNLKVGGSPLYYLSGQEHKLQNFTENLNGVEKKAYDILSQNKILKDSEQEPAIRVALRQIRDFAIPLQVNYENKIEIFWKWYLIDNKGVELLIKNKLSEKKEEISDKKLQNQQENTTQERLLGPKEEDKKKEATKEIRKTIDKGLFLREVNIFFDKNKINIGEKDIKKSSEINFIIHLQTSLGDLKYFCKAKNKKKISDADLSSALIQAQLKNLPLLFLTNGTLTKKSQEMLDNEFKNITIKKI